MLVQKAGKWARKIMSPALECFGFKGIAGYHAAWDKPEPSTCGGWITFGKRNFLAPEEEGKHKDAEAHGEAGLWRL